jgi:hypothetical protein
LHADTPSFSVQGQHALDAPDTESATEPEEGEPAVIAVTDGSSRDHRDDLKQWMVPW